MYLGRLGRLSVLVTISILHPATARVFTTADIFRVESVGVVVSSPDDAVLAIVRTRGRSATTMHMRDFMDGRNRSDVLIYDLASEKLTNITNGDVDGSGFFAPVWSPDGGRLALLSTRGNSITLWEWNRLTRKLRQVSNDVLDLGNPVWVSNSEVVCATPPEGEQPWLFDLETRAPTKAMSAWPKSWLGNEVTASTLASGTSLRGNTLPTGRLLRINVATRRVETLAKGIYSGISSSPDGRLVAAYELAERFGPEPGVRLANRSYFKYRLVAFEGRVKRTVVELSDQQEVQTGGPIVWLAERRLAVKVLKSPGRADWFVAGINGEKPVNITAAFQSVPPVLVSSPNARLLFAVSDGKIWSLSAESASSAGPRPLLDDPQIRVQSILTRREGTLFIRAQLNGKSGLFVFSPDRGILGAVSEPTGGAELKAFLARADAAVFTEATSAGTSVFLVGSDRLSRRTILSLNGFVREVAPGVLKSYEYAVVPDGPRLTAWMLLPPDYDASKRYPTVVSPYPGLVYTSAIPPRADIQSTGPYNPQLLAAAGFAVLFPSIPLSPEGQPGEPYRQTIEAVLPAVDEAIRVGLADPDRLAVMGHSFGGYGAYALITQTSRFKAAIVMGGFANLVSLYGQFDARARYEDDARARLIFMMFAESGQFRMGAPPWSDMDRYIRNSPITHADRVQTPVMIVQGDQDYVPIQQGEEFFSALFRQNKPALFVRYWGEGHVLESPANITDLWIRIHRWLGQYLRPTLQ